MTVTEFVAMVRDAAKAQSRPVLAVDFEPRHDKSRIQIEVTFRFKDGTKA